MGERERKNETSRVRVLGYERPSVLRLFGLVFALVSGLAMVLGAMLSAAQAQAAPQYDFTKVADSAEDGFDPNNFGCASINDPGDVAFRAGRVAGDGFNTIDGIYRADADGGLTTIAQNRKRFDFIGVNPSMNDRGGVSFAATLDGGNYVILRDNGQRQETIATTAGKFNFFGFDTSVNNDGVVAFKAELDERFDFDEGLFSGRGKRVTTHYLTSTSDFDGSDSRPSINNVGNIAFDESINFDSGNFVGRTGNFQTIAAPDPDVSVGTPVLNDTGTAAFERSFFDEANQVFEIVTGNGAPLTTVADTRGDFASFGFRPPSLNDNGDVAFLADLDSGGSGIFVGPGPVEDRVIGTGDTLDGSTVQNLVFCEEGLNDSGQLAFIAQLEDPDSPEGFRVAVFRATPAP